MTASASGSLVQNSDYLVAATYWRYLALRQLGRHSEAAQVAGAVSADLVILENHAYYDGVRLFQGSMLAEDLPDAGDSVSRFAVAMQHRFDGQHAEALALLRDIVSGAPNGFWPAEAEILRMEEPQ